MRTERLAHERHRGKAEEPHHLACGVAQIDDGRRGRSRQRRQTTGTRTPDAGETRATDVDLDGIGCDV